MTQPNWLLLSKGAGMFEQSSKTIRQWCFYSGKETLISWAYKARASHRELPPVIRLKLQKDLCKLRGSHSNPLHPSPEKAEGELQSHFCLWSTARIAKYSVKQAAYGYMDIWNARWPASHTNTTRGSLNISFKMLISILLLLLIRTAVTKDLVQLPPIFLYL